MQLRRSSGCRRKKSDEGVSEMPVRSCVCCRKECEKGSLLRVILSDDAGLRVALDALHQRPGRGAYVCLECLERKELLGRLETSLQGGRPPGKRREVKKLSGGFRELLTAAAMHARNARELAAVEKLRSSLDEQRVSADSPKPAARPRLGFRRG